ncbi:MULTISPECIES: c-type cytochrome [Prochlorococcus]|uniref:c-type cytochrome n=1 Tax=Prochlorococcus TaxID=1218 RepID=UPI000A654F03|nr:MULTISPECIES: c-type cytochrome [Prochlorococcus]
MKALLIVSLIFFSIISIPCKISALDSNKGESLFMQHCAGCHINGGNVIRRNKTLKIKDLQRNKLDNIENIAQVAREGVGIMSGYEEVLGPEGDILVAEWVLSKAQKAWIQE